MHVFILLSHPIDPFQAPIGGRAGKHDVFLVGVVVVVVAGR